MISPTSTLSSDLADLLRTFARRPRNWVVLARNLIPVVGVYALGWWSGITLLYYWIDGLVPLALLLLAIFGRGMAMMVRDKRVGLGGAIVQGSIGFGLYFFLLGIPFYMVYDALNLGAPFDEAWNSPALATGLWATVLVNVVSAFQRGGYFGSSMEDFRERANPELEMLMWRGLSMLLIYMWTRGMLMIPLFALWLTAREVWPTVKADLALAPSG